MSPADRDVLIVRYLDGTAGPDEVAALNAVLKEDAEARALIRDAALQAIALADFGRSRALQAPRRPVPEARWNPRLLAAAAVLIAAALGFVALLGTPAPSLTLVRATGAVTWSPVGGLPRHRPGLHSTLIQKKRAGRLPLSDPPIAFLLTPILPAKRRRKSCRYDSTD